MKLSEFITLESGSRPRGGVRGILKGVPSLGGEHLNSDGGFNFDKVKYIPDEFFDSLNHGRIHPNDILVVKDGATTGKTSFVSEDFPYKRAAINEHLFIVRVDRKIAFPNFVFYYLFSDEGQTQIKLDFRGATVGGISRKFSTNVNVPLPPLSEQRQIVDQVEHHLSLANKVEATLDAETRRAEQLRQAILKHAFSGKLVPQNPDDQPPGSLIDQVKQQKEQQHPLQEKSLFSIAK